MKSLLFSALAAAFVLGATTVKAATPEELLTQAQAAFAQRDYTADGIKHAQDAVDAYTQLVGMTTDKKAIAQYSSGLSESLYFVGDASSDNNIKLSVHQQGITAADNALKLYNVTNVSSVAQPILDSLKALPADEQATLGGLLYQRGANLGKWGEANGILASLNKWPELRDTMQLIINIGQKADHQYGAYRILGRGYYKIPGFLGGDVQKSMQFLSAAVKNTLVPGTIFSKSGYNNIYLADVYKDNGKADQAKAILQAFVAADPASIDANSVVEIKKSQKDAQDMLNNM